MTQTADPPRYGLDLDLKLAGLGLGLDLPNARLVAAQALWLYGYKCQTKNRIIIKYTRQ